MGYCENKYLTKELKEVYKKGYVMGNADKVYKHYSLQHLKPQEQIAWKAGYQEAQEKHETNVSRNFAEEYFKSVVAPKRKRNHLEEELQIACIEWMAWQYPNVLCWHTPNGGSRNKIEAAKLKHMGVKPGVPDIFVALPIKPYAGFFCELKAGKNGLTGNQCSVINQLLNAGYHVCQANSLEEYQELWGRYLKNDQN